MFCAFFSHVVYVPWMWFCSLLIYPGISICALAQEVYYSGIFQVPFVLFVSVSSLALFFISACWTGFYFLLPMLKFCSVPIWQCSLLLSLFCLLLSVLSCQHMRWLFFGSYIWGLGGSCIIQRPGQQQEHCGNPLLTSLSSLMFVSKDAVRWLKKLFVRLYKFWGHPLSLRLFSLLGHQDELKAPSTSRLTIAVTFPILNPSSTNSFTAMTAYIVLTWGANSYLLLFM